MIKDSANNVAREFNIGKTKIKICTDYCNNKSQKEINELLNNIAGKTKHNLKNAAYLEINKS